MRINQNLNDYSAIADDGDLSYEEKLERYRKLADDYFDAERFEEFVATALPSLDEHVVDYVESAAFDDVLVHVVQEGEPAELHERLIEHCRDRVATWASEQRALG